MIILTLGRFEIISLIIVLTIKITTNNSDINSKIESSGSETPTTVSVLSKPTEKEDVTENLSPNSASVVPLSDSEIKTLGAPATRSNIVETAENETPATESEETIETQIRNKRAERIELKKKNQALREQRTMLYNNFEAQNNPEQVEARTNRLKVIEQEIRENQQKRGIIRQEIINLMSKKASLQQQSSTMPPSNLSNSSESTSSSTSSIQPSTPSNSSSQPSDLSPSSTSNPSSPPASPSASTSSIHPSTPVSPSPSMPSIQPSTPASPSPSPSTPASKTPSTQIQPAEPSPQTPSPTPTKPITPPKPYPKHISTIPASKSAKSQPSGAAHSFSLKLGSFITLRFSCAFGFILSTSSPYFVLKLSVLMQFNDTQSIGISSTNILMLPDEVLDLRKEKEGTINLQRAQWRLDLFENMTILFKIEDFVFTEDQVIFSANLAVIATYKKAVLNNTHVLKNITVDRRAESKDIYVDFKDSLALKLLPGAVGETKFKSDLFRKKEDPKKNKSKDSNSKDKRPQKIENPDSQDFKKAKEEVWYRKYAMELVVGSVAVAGCYYLWSEDQKKSENRKIAQASVGAQNRTMGSPQYKEKLLYRTDISSDWY